jgi:hypothetical protein
MKKKQIKIVVLLLISSLFFSNGYAQGCSDAGFCSVGNAFKNADSEVKNSIDLGAVYGIAEEDVTVFSQYITYTRDFNEKFALSTKITSAVANGSFGTRGNIGDVFVTGNYKLKSKFSALEGTKAWSLMLGAKIPLTSANDKINNYSLPMVYQSSLGTFDILGGVNLMYKKWDFNTAFQIPLTQNKNSYLTEFSGTNLFPSTNLFERKPDVLFRTTYKLKSTNEKFTFRPNVLFIYHLGEDSFENVFGQRETIQNSDGLTINGNLIVSYKLSKKSYLESSIASPFVVRKERPDGLTRAVTLGLSYKTNF